MHKLHWFETILNSFDHIIVPLNVRTKCVGNESLSLLHSSPSSLRLKGCSTLRLKMWQLA